MDAHDREIISVAVVSHSSSKDIARETAHLHNEEWIGIHRVRPRLIAALVRLADELDEDHRRADPLLQARVGLPEESKFFWEFSQRIIGIRPKPDSQEIQVHIKFLKADVGRNVLIEGRMRPFVSAFADKLAKINRERVVVGTFLPDDLRYHRIRASVKPIPDHPTWKEPREFTFFDSTNGSQFVAAFPELLEAPARQQIINVLELIRQNELGNASSILGNLEMVAQDLPTSVLLLIYYDGACIESRRADSTDSNEERTLAVDRSLRYIKQWLALGLTGAWEEEGKSPYNEIFKMGRDSDLYRLFLHRRKRVARLVPEDLRSALPTELPRRHSPGAGGGSSGCVPKGTLIQTPAGEVPIEWLREGDAVLSVDIEGSGGVFETRVEKVHTLREPKCVQINHRFRFTPSHRLFSSEGMPIRAGDVADGTLLMRAKFSHEEVSYVELVDGYFEVYNITTDHSSHNYMVDGLVCRNARYWK